MKAYLKINLVYSIITQTVWCIYRSWMDWNIYTPWNWVKQIPVNATIRENVLGFWLLGLLISGILFVCRHEAKQKSPVNE